MQAPIPSRPHTPCSHLWQEKYNIPTKYTTLMKSFFTSYMTEIYVNDRDMDK